MGRADAITREKVAFLFDIDSLTLVYCETPTITLLGELLFCRRDQVGLDTMLRAQGEQLRKKVGQASDLLKKLQG